jgi:hypothetical protein
VASWKIIEKIPFQFFCFNSNNNKLLPFGHRQLTNR